MRTTATTQFHLYTAQLQPAHRFFIHLHLWGKRRHWVTRSKRSLLWARCCGKKRWAGRCVVQAYYDGVYFFCRKGQGCKS